MDAGLPLAALSQSRTLFELGLIVVLAAASPLLAQVLRLPSILVLLALGFGAGAAGALDPNALLGQSLISTVVSIAVGIILFDAGLGLNVSKLSGSVARVYRRLVSLGILVTWAVGTVAAYLLFDLSWEVALVLGAVLVVYAMVGLGVLGVFAGAPGLLWLGLIGLFLILAGKAEESAVALQSTFKGLGLRRVMAVPAATLEADTLVADALRDSFAPLGYHAFPVVEGRVPVGLLDINQVGAIPARERATTRVGDLADRDSSVFVDDEVTIDQLLANPAFRRHGRAVVRGHDGEIGMLSATAIQRAVRARRMLEDHGPATPIRAKRAA